MKKTHRTLAFSLLLLLLLFPVFVLAGSAETPVRPYPGPIEDRETVVIAQRIGTQDYAIVAWMEGTTKPEIRVASSRIFSSGFGTWTTKRLCVFCTSPTGVTGDPFLAENAYSSGIAPKRVYLVGTSYERNADDTYGKNQISVWTSDDGGETWTDPPAAALSRCDDGTWFGDKPSVAVSWEPRTLGRVYVAHMAYNKRPLCGNECPSEIRVFRSSDDGTFPAPDDPGCPPSNATGVIRDVSPPGTLPKVPDSPIVLVHPNYMDYVYVVWLERQYNKINVAFSTDGGRTFPVVRSTCAGPEKKFEPGECTSVLFYGGGGDDRLYNGQGASILARSMLMARFNEKAGTIGIVWHARQQPDDPTAQADVKFMTWDPVNYQFGTRWTVTKTQTLENPDAPTHGNQWNPALDYDSNGYYMVTYYDDRGLTQSASEFNYHVKAAYLYSDGYRMQPPQSDLRFTQPSNLLLYASRGVGEYQDIWNWFGKWYAAFIQISSSGGDAAVTRITP